MISMDITWEDKKKNKETVREYVEKAAKKAVSLVLFPEMTLTGFTRNITEMAEPLENSETIEFFLELSKTYSMALGFGCAVYRKKKIVSENDKAENHFLIVKDGRILADYAKLHPFSYGGENRYYQGGSSLEYVKIEDITFGMFICYDLRFPEPFLAGTKKSEAFLVIANWPEERVEQWEVLLKARAVETQSFFLGVNRTGEGDGLHYVESSFAVMPDGRILEAETKEGMHIVSLDVEEVKKIRLNFPVIEDRRISFYRKFYEE